MDCLFIGHNDGSFEADLEWIKLMGESSGAYRDVNLNYVEYQGKPVRAMDLLNQMHFAGQKPDRILYNGDYLNLAIAYLGSYISQHGFSFDYVNIFQLEKEKLRQKLVEEEILAIAIPTTLYVTLPPIMEIISFIRKYNTTAKIIIGGPFILNQITKNDEPDNIVFKTLEADFYVCSPEGEKELVQILDALKHDCEFAAIPNLMYKSGDKYVKTERVAESTELRDNLINWELFRREDISNAVSLRTAKSCPFSCSFCGFPVRSGKYRYLDVESVELELNKLHELGVEGISFIDDTFNVPPARFKELMRMMIRNKYSFKWNAYFRCQYADVETVELMRESGCEGVYLGIESGSNAILKNMHKNTTVEAYYRGIELLNRYGIMTHASFIVGFPGETDATVQQTMRFIEDTAPTFFRTQLWYYDHITPIYQERDKYGIEGLGFQWAHNTMTSERACDWIEHIFLGVKNSQWLPQNGFDYLSLYYLQRRGMSAAQMLEFVKTFNQLVKSKFAPQALTPAELCGRLQELSQFTSPV